MPAAYTHYRFGQAVLAQLPEALRSQIQPHQALFDIGLHGPDILFYYQPLGKNPVNQLGHQAHNCSGQAWFSAMWGRAQGPAARAYVYGFVCHYALDAACHGYINETAQKGLCTHSLLETELDRHYLAADGKDPMRHKPIGHIHPNASVAAEIAPFFPEVSPRQILACLRTMILVESLFVASNPLKRGAVHAIMKALGQYRSLGDLMRRYQAPAHCAPLLEPVTAMFTAAVPRAAQAICSLEAWAEGRSPFPAWFALPFDPQTATQAP